MMKKTIVTFLAAITAFSVWAAKTGSRMEDAKKIKVGGSATVKLVAEYDEFDKSYDSDSGVYWLKVQLNRGSSYTVWIQGGSAGTVGMDIDTADTEDDDDVPGASFDDVVSATYNGAPIQYAHMAADAWDSEDPSKFYYAICITGDVGNQTTVYVQSGIRNFSQKGDENSPEAVSFTTGWKSVTRKLIDGNYYLKATLSAGCKYRVRTLKGTVAKPLDLAVDTASDELTYDDWSDPLYVKDSNYTKTQNVATVIVPDSKGTFLFEVSDATKAGSNLNGQFTFSFKRVPALAIGSHKAVTLSPENGWSHQFVPGRISADENYYDSIIDENLCVISLAKGDRVVFDTDDAFDATYEMIVYNPSGKIIGRNTTVGNGSYDMRVAIQADVAGKYYVGVYDTTLDVGDRPPAEATPLTLTAYFADDKFGPADAADPVDDVFSGATELVPAPLSYGQDVLVGGSQSEVHAFNGGDWRDWYKVACRAGQTYQFKAEYASDETTDIVLGYEICTLNSKGVPARVTYASGTKTYVEGDTLEDGVTLNATKNAMYYIRVFPALTDGTNVIETAGLDYPDYRVRSGVTKVKAFNAATDVVTDPVTGEKVTNVVDIALGKLVVKSTGVAGTYSLGTETTTYPTGTSLELAANSYTVKYTPPTGFKATLASEVAAIEAWDTNSSTRVVADQPVTTLTARFYDIYDQKYVMSTTKKTTTKTVNGKKTTVTTTVNNYSPETGDNTMEGAFALPAPTNTTKTVRRSLYVEDTTDFFKFTAVAGRAYTLSLADYVDGGATGAVMTLIHASNGVLPQFSKVKTVDKALLPAGVIYVQVEHAEGCEDKDSSYALSYQAMNVGTVGFTAANFNAAESGEYATLTLKRTAKQGAVSVNYTTVAGTAQPGSEYYPASGVVKWASGDMANKTIKIRLIPDLEPTWESNKVFTVRLWEAERADFAAGDYPVGFIAGRDSATVTITEATAVKAGTVSITGYGPSESEITPVANLKAPVVSGQVGAPLVLRLSRTGGTNGIVGVKFAFPGKNGKVVDTAVKAKDYVARAETDDVVNTVVWENFDATDKYVTINTLMTTNYTLSKQFTFTLAALTTKGYAKPALSAATGTAKLINNTVGTTAASFANTVKAVGGITQAVTGTWYVDRNDGEFKSSPANATLTYTLTGPGFFAIKPRLNDGGDAETPSTATLKLQIGTLNAKKAFVASETIDCLAEGAPERIERLIAGSKVVKLTFAGGNKKEFVELENDADTGLPFKWVRFATVAADRPMAKSVVTTNGLESLRWKVPAALQDENIKVVARFGTVAKLAAAHDLVTNDVDVASAPIAEGTLLPAKTYYWTLAFGLGDEPETWIAHPTTWSFSVIKDGFPETSFGGLDPWGDNISLKIAKEEPITLIQTLKAPLTLTGTASANRFRLAGGKLPPGLAINATTGKLTGAPSTPGEYDALLQAYYYKQTTKTVNRKKVTTTTTNYGTTQQVKFIVEPAGLAIGTFRGALVETGAQVSKNSAKTGLVTVSTTSAGKITATVKVSGNSYTFTGTGYDELTDEKDDGGLGREFSVKLRNITSLVKTTTKTVNGKKTTVKTSTPYTNELELVVWDGSVTNATAIGESIGSARLVMNVPNTLVAKATTMEGGIEYNAELFRACGGTDVGKAALAPFAGYYTIALAPSGVSAADGVPLGNGYLTMTLSETGGATFAGMLADGAAVSVSSAASVQGADVLDPDQCVVCIPFHFSADIRSVTGVMKLVYATDGDGNAAPVVDSTSMFLWSRDKAAAASLDGLGYAIDVAPTGGWYNKTWNVQRYYLDSDLAIQAAGAEELAAVADATGTLGTGYEFKPYCTPTDLSVKLTNNGVSVDKRALVKESSTLLYDLAKSVNPWAATYSYARATGLVSGTFSAWKETPATTKQGEIKSIAHKGVMIFFRDDASPLDENAWSAGYYLIQATKNWKASLPFNVIATPISGGRDWNETPVPGEEPDGD